MVIADAADSDRELLKALGADIVVSRGDGFADKIREHFPQGVDGLADGALLNARAVDAVKDGGSFTAIRGFKGEGQRDIKFTATWVTGYDGAYEKLDLLREQVEGGVLTLRVAGSVTPEDVGLAYQRLEQGGSRGRMVIEF